MECEQRWRCFTIGRNRNFGSAASLLHLKRHPVAEGVWLPFLIGKNLQGSKGDEKAFALRLGASARLES